MVAPLDRKLLRDVARIWPQVLTIGLVVAAGIAGLITMQSTYGSLLRSRDGYYERQRFGDVFVHLERAPDSLLSRLEALPGVAVAYPRLVESVRIPMERVAQPPIGHLVSLPEGDAPLNALYLAEGRLPDPARRDEAVLLAKFSEKQGLGIGDRVPVVVNGARHDLRIVGLAMSPEYIYPVASGGEVSPDDERFAVLWLPREVLAPMLKMEGAFNDLVLRVQHGASTDAVIGAVDRVLEPYGGLGAVDRALQPSNYVLTSEMDQLKGLATVIPMIFLGVAAFLLNVVLSRLVLLQRGQIAILKALGYADRRIALHFLELVAVVVLVGAVVGIAVGAYLGTQMTQLYADVFGIPQFAFEMGAKELAIATAVSIGAAVAGASFAVFHVARLPPAEAMRPPSPATYRPTLLDRLGLEEWLDQPARMVLRELERKPVRALLSTVGVAMACAILVTGRFYLDAVDHLVRVQFERASREDLAVAFTNPVPMRSVRALADLPGVVEVDSLRNVPVRFRAGPRSREGIAVGYPADARLRRVVDRWGAPVPLPAEGALVTTKLAELLGVKVGDLIELEVREGERELIPVRVAGLADELIGLQAHFPLESLLRLLGEEHGVSTALLRIDRHARDDLQRRLADMPNVASVTSRPANTALFRKRMRETVVVMTLIVTAFAATIAVGVVYNNARVALSTRARDLASLRVIGLTRAEVSGILLGELGIQVLAAIPIGLLIGRWLAHGVAATTHTERIRFPVVISAQTYAFAVLVTLAAAIVSALLVRRQLDRVDLVGVLKTRE